jgi:hypothetical protein
MNRYSLDIFKNPVMHNKGKYCLYKDHMIDIEALKTDVKCYEQENNYFKKQIEEKNYQYEHALRIANEAQMEASTIKIESQVLCGLVIALVMVEFFMFISMF